MEIIATSFLLYQLTNLCNYLLHRFAQHKENTTHMKQHHRLYNRKRHSSGRFRWIGYVANSEIAYGFMILSAFAFSFMFLPNFVTMVFLVQMPVHLFLFHYFHISFHKKHGFIQRFKWFRKLKALHHIHHRSVHSNFSVFDFTFDRIFKTYIGPVANATSR